MLLRPTHGGTRESGWRAGHWPAGRRLSTAGVHRAVSHREGMTPLFCWRPATDGDVKLKGGGRQSSTPGSVCSRRSAGASGAASASASASASRIACGSESDSAGASTSRITSDCITSDCSASDCSASDCSASDSTGVSPSTGAGDRASDSARGTACDCVASDCIASDAQCKRQCAQRCKRRCERQCRRQCKRQRRRKVQAAAQTAVQQETATRPRRSDDASDTVPLTTMDTGIVLLLCPVHS